MGILGRMSGIRNTIVAVYGLISISFIWLITIWMRYGITAPIQTAQYMTTDLAWLGPIAFIFDLVFFFIVFRLVWMKIEKDRHKDPDTVHSVNGKDASDSLSSPLNSKTNK